MTGDARTIRIGAGLDLPIDAVTETFGVLGVKGSGKTTTAKVLVEGLTAAGQQCVIIDPLGVWWGLKSSADGTETGFPFTVLGGDHGDVPITGEAGQTIADLAIDGDTSLVIDLSLMRKAEQRRFMVPFVEQLYHRNRQPLHLVVDECDLFIHQRPVKGEERLVGAMEDLVRRGRVKGIGVTLISQRPASVHKDVLSQVSVLVAHRLVGPQDRAALKAWVQAHGDPEREAQMMANLAGLATGCAWFWSPSWLDFFGQVQVDLPITFDSSATPKAGARRLEPKVLAPVDIEALRDRLASIVAQAEADDPKVLRRRVLELEREITTLRNGEPTKVIEVETIVTVERVPDWVGDTLGDALSKVGDLEQLLLEALKHPVDSTPKPSLTLKADRRPVPHRSPNEAQTSPVPAPVTKPTSAGPVDGLKSGAVRILETVASAHPRPLTQAQVGTLAGFKTSGGTFGTYKSALRTRGLIEVDDAGLWTITDTGLALAAPRAPLTTEEVLDRWRGALKAGCRTMLDLLVEIYPTAISRDELADRLGMTASGGTFGTYLSKLRSNGLAVTSDGVVRADDSLFIPWDEMP